LHVEHRNHQPPAIERIDHLVGEMVTFGFCARHMPTPSFLERCVTAKDVMGWRGRVPHVRRPMP